MSAITTQKVDNLPRLPEEAKGCDRPPGWLRPGVTHMKLWILALWMLISGGILNVTIAEEIKDQSDSCKLLSEQIIQMAEDFDLDGIQKLADELESI